MPRGPKPKTHCIHGHELTGNNSVQLYDKNGAKNGHRCRRCHQTRMRIAARADVTGSHYRSRMRHQNGTLYGWEYDRDAQLASQGGACAICGITGLTWGKGFMKVWHTDHVHGQEGTHRGVLCAACNTALGRLEPHFSKVLAYLAKYAVEQGTR